MNIFRKPSAGHSIREGRLAHPIGRDYADVAPMDGVIFASGGQRLDVRVSVIPVK